MNLPKSSIIDEIADHRDELLNENRKLNQRIKRLEEELNELRSNEAGLLNSNGELERRIKRLEEWKESALAVEREWDANAVATMLGGKLGESHRKVIQREAPKLLTRIKRLEEGGDEAIYPLEYAARVRIWTEAKEDKL